MIEIIQSLLLLLIWIVLVLSLRSLTTLFHELGHALPALAFTNKQVQVFIGTYGNSQAGWAIQLGRLSIHFKFNFLAWNIGLCQHQGINVTWKRIIVILGGPLASTLLAIPLVYLLSSYELSNTWIYILLLFIIAAVIDLIVNLTPFSSAMSLHDGSSTYNDGYQLGQIIVRFFLSENYLELEKAFLEKDYTNFYPKAIEAVEAGEAERPVYDLLVYAYLEEKAWDDALIVYEKINERFKLDIEDYGELGQVYFELGQYEQALKCDEAYLYHHYTDTKTLVHKAEVLTALSRFDEAIAICNKVLKEQPSYLYAFAIRGLAFAKKGLGLDAKLDLAILKRQGKDKETLVKYVEAIEAYLYKSPKSN